MSDFPKSCHIYVLLADSATLKMCLTQRCSMFLLYMCRVAFSHTGACPGCSDNPTATTVYPSDEGAFIPIHTQKLVIVGSSQQPVASDAALAGISITVIIIDGVLTVVVSIFSIWLMYTLYVWRRRRRASECSSTYGTSKLFNLKETIL